MRTQVSTCFAAKRSGKLFLACIAAPFVLALSLAVMPLRSAPRTSGKQIDARGQDKNAGTLNSVSNRYGKIPLSFEPNVGQSDPQVQYISRASGYALFLTPRETVFLLKSGSPKTSDATKSGLNGSAPFERGSSLRLQFLNSNPGAPLTAANKLPGKINYLIGSDSKSWHTNIPTFATVAQHDLYRGIDVVYYGTQQQLEYDFVVSAGADPRAIALSFAGSKKVHVDQSGDLIVSVPAGDVRMRKPLVYQQAADGERKLVAAKYVLRGASRASISVGSYNQKQTLIIDPILEYSTYLGGSNIDGGNAIAVAQDRTAFIAGGTFSTDFPTAHPLQPNHGGPDDFARDAFVAKLSADGSTLLYATYLGGKNEDIANGIAVDTFGDAYVTGTTLSPDFPVTPGSFNTECGGDGNCGATLNPQHLIVSNAFVTKLNPAGSALIYSGFLGEYENVIGQAITVDTNLVAYVTGQTGANITPTVPIIPPDVPPPPFPITSNAAQPNFGGGFADAFLSKISSTGTSILYSTYVGGGNEDFAFGVGIDASANAYVTGISYSPDFPVTGSALQPFNAGAGDAFVTKINTLGGPFAYSTLLGGSGIDQGNGIAVDPTGIVYVAGESSSPGLFTSPRPYGGNGDGFVAKLNPALSGSASLLYFTYLGGSLADTANGVAFDGNGNAYVTGSTVSSDFPVVGAVFQPVYGGGNADAFVTKLDPTGASIIYSTFLGGSNTESGNSIGVDTIGSAYVTGQTCSLDFPLTNPEQAGSGGNCDAFISKVSVLNGIILNPTGLVFQSLNVGATSLPQTVTLTTGDSSVSINFVGIGGVNPGDFTQTTTCGGSVPSGMQCTFRVTFSPTAVGLRKGTLIIGDTENGSPVTHVVALTGSTSTVQLSASSLNFGSQSIGVATAPQTITLTNVGSSALTVSGIVASSDFGQTNNCTKAPLQPGTNCVVNVTYTATTSGASLGALTITDNVPGSPQVVLLNGTGLTPDFTVASESPSISIAAGQTASFTVDVSSISGFAQSVALSCGGAPTASTCSVSPASVSLSANGKATATVTVATKARTILPPAGDIRRTPRLPFTGFHILALIALMALASKIVPARRHAFVTSCLLLLVPVLVMSACNGGTAVQSGSGTPAGSFQLVITGSAGTMSHSIPVNLLVK